MKSRNTQNIKLLSLFILLILVNLTFAQVNGLNFQELLPEKYDKANIIKEEDYNVWGTNILKGKDGKYHAIYSRWPKSRGSSRFQAPPNGIAWKKISRQPRSA